MVDLKKQPIDSMRLRRVGRIFGGTRCTTEWDGGCLGKWERMVLCNHPYSGNSRSPAPAGVRNLKGPARSAPRLAGHAHHVVKQLLQMALATLAVYSLPQEGLDVTFPQ